MKKKQLYAILLAGVVAAGSAPSAAFAAEANAVQTAAETEEGTSGENPEAATETPAAEPTQPVEPTATAAPTEPAEPTVTEAPENTPSPTAAPENTPSPEVSPTATPEPENTGISITTKDADGKETVTYYKTLQEAVDAAPTIESGATESTVIEITDILSLSSTIDISGKKVSIVSAKAGVSITRGIPEGGTALFDGDLFRVSGEGSELQLSVKEGGDLTVDGMISEDTQASGSLVNVSDKGAFGMSAGVTLKNNNSKADGSAIYNNNGSIVFKGGTITGNTGAKGAVYSNVDVAVQGTVSIKENTGADLYLDANAAAVITDAMADSAISLTTASPAEGQTVVKAGKKADGTPVSEEEFKVALAMITFSSEEFTIESAKAEDGTLTGVLKKKVTEPTVTPGISPSVTPSVTAAPSPTPTKTPSFLTYQSKSLKWVDHNTVRATMSTTKDCKWYYFFVKANTDTNTIKKMYDASKATTEAKANTKFTVVAENVPEEDSWLVVAAKPTSGSAQLRVLKLNSSSRPASSSPTPSVTTRAPRTYKVTESTVTGLEEPLQFYPRKFYEFQVVGAGQNDTNPVSGDERWIPQYWSMSVNGTKNTSWQIGSQSKGIRDAATYPLYIFFKKQVYNGSEWVDTDVVEYMKTSFSSAAISDKEWKAYIDSYNQEHPNDGLNYDGTGAGSVADLTPTDAASVQDGASTNKAAADTADNSPVGSMSALAALSLLAGGYVIVRKRKKEEI